MVEVGFLFDMDGVVVDTNRYHRQAIHEFCDAHGISVSEEFLRSHVYGRINREWIPALFGPLGPHEQTRLADEKEERFRQIYEPYMVELAGLNAFLAASKRNNIPVVLATSAPTENARFVIGGLGLQDQFKHVLTSVDVTKGKPDPEIYLLAAERIETNPNQCVVFEDSLAGVEAGLEAGCKVVAVTTTHSESELARAHRVIKDFSEISVAEMINLAHDR